MKTISAECVSLFLAAFAFADDKSVQKRRESTRRNG
jgi:hypothetical protein